MSSASTEKHSGNLSFFLLWIKNGFQVSLCALALMPLVLLSGSAEAQGLLSIGYYDKTCPKAEVIVTTEIRKALRLAPSLAAALLRLHFHDCFVRGCDGSVLLNSTAKSTAEKDAIVNRGLRGYGLIDRVKAKLEEACPEVVSCADILALAARDAVVFAKGPSWPVATGRRDGRVSLAIETIQLPPATGNISVQTSIFAAQGLDLKDLVVLSGGHTIGIAHCVTFSDRLYNYSGKGDVDPSLDKEYLPKLRAKCKPADRVSFVEMDPGSYKTFDVAYYEKVAKRRGVFHSDGALLDHPLTKAYVQRYAAGTAGFTEEFFADFAQSMIKMGSNKVLTGSAGEIRNKCALIN